MNDKPKRRAKTRKQRKQRTPQARYGEIVQALCSDPTVTFGSGKRGSGASALCIGSKIFALLSSQNHFVVKLPRTRVDALVTDGAGQRFDSGHGRLMKRWLEVTDESPHDWLDLANEAKAFVVSKV